jgi:hypothetical protein
MHKLDADHGRHRTGIERRKKSLENQGFTCILVETRRVSTFVHEPLSALDIHLTSDERGSRFWITIVVHPQRWGKPRWVDP